MAFSSLFSIISFSFTCLNGPNDLLYISFFIFSEFWSRLYFSTSSQHSQFIDRNVRGPHVGSRVSTLVMAGGNPSTCRVSPILPSEAFQRAKVQILPGEVTSRCSYPSYLQQTVNSFMMLFPGNRMTARRQIPREHGTCVLLVAPEISRVG